MEMVQNVVLRYNLLHATLQANTNVYTVSSAEDSWLRAIRQSICEEGERPRLRIREGLRA
eukprot:6178709-Pleurochrysis_carterae.AAC.2